MKVKCRTNLDLHYEVWPDDLPAIPRVGDLIESCVTHNKTFKLRLEVYSVTWRQNQEPEIELHIPNYRQWSIAQFYEWYAPLVGKSVHAFI